MPARAACSGLAGGGRPVVSTTGSGTSFPPCTASAKCRSSRSSVSAAAAAATPTSSVPVTTQVGACASTLVAATRPAPARSVRTGRPSPSSSTIASPVLVGCANTPVDPGPRSSRRATLSRRISAQRPTITRSTSWPSDCSSTERETALTPAFSSRFDTSSHERSASSAHTSRTGKRLPSRPVTNGSGNAPDDRRDPLGGAPHVVVPPDALAGAQATLGGPDGRLDPVDVVEPVRGPPAGAPAGQPVDLLHEPAAVPRLHVVVALQQPHHGVALGGGLRVDALVQGLGAEVARHRERHLAGGLALAEAAAGDGTDDRAQEQEDEPPHPAIDTFRGNARTRPALDASSRSAPPDPAGTVSSATPPAPLTAVPCRA